GARVHGRSWMVRGFGYTVKRSIISPTRRCGEVMNQQCGRAAHRVQMRVILSQDMSPHIAISIWSESIFIETPATSLIHQLYLVAHHGPFLYRRLEGHLTPCVKPPVKVVTYCINLIRAN